MALMRDAVGRWPSSACSSFQSAQSTLYPQVSDPANGLTCCSCNSACRHCVQPSPSLELAVGKCNCKLCRNNTRKEKGRLAYLRPRPLHARLNGRATLVFNRGESLGANGTICKLPDMHQCMSGLHSTSIHNTAATNHATT